MKHLFCTARQVVKTETEAFTLEQLTDLINTKRPTEIWHGQWSSKMPFIVITEYNSEGFKMYCNGWADKEPEQFSSKELYKMLRVQGLGSCYIIEPSTEPIVNSKT